MQTKLKNQNQKLKIFLNFDLGFALAFFCAYLFVLQFTYGLRFFIDFILCFLNYFLFPIRVNSELMKSVFVCQNCGYESPKWLGRYPSCQSGIAWRETQNRAGQQKRKQETARRRSALTRLAFRRKRKPQRV